MKDVIIGYSDTAYCMKAIRTGSFHVLESGTGGMPDVWLRDSV